MLKNQGPNREQGEKSRSKNRKAEDLQIQKEKKTAKMVTKKLTVSVFSFQYLQFWVKFWEKYDQNPGPRNLASVLEREREGDL